MWGRCGNVGALCTVQSLVDGENFSGKQFKKS